MGLIMVAVILLPGCAGVVDWAETTFKQAEGYQYNRELVNEYIRSIRIYDQFTTIAIFDALWLSDEIRTEYADLYVKMHGRTQFFKIQESH